jgi:hypothetical protein
MRLDKMLRNIEGRNLSSIKLPTNFNTFVIVAFALQLDSRILFFEGKRGKPKVKQFNGPMNDVKELFDPKLVCTPIIVIGHGILAGNYLARCHDLLNSQSLMYVDNRQLSLKICG